MDSRPTPKSSCPACVHAKQMTCELPSCQQASYMVQYNGNEQAERLAKGANYNVPLQSIVQQCLAQQSMPLAQWRLV